MKEVERVKVKTGRQRGRQREEGVTKGGKKNEDEERKCRRESWMKHKDRMEARTGGTAQGKNAAKINDNNELSP